MRAILGLVVATSALSLPALPRSRALKASDGVAEKKNAARTLAAASAYSVVGGSFNLWSLFVPGLQDSLGCTRAALSGVFGLSTTAFTLGASLGARVFGRTSVPAAVLATGWCSAAGLVAASRASSLPALALAYAGVFGTSSGVAYALNAKIATAPGLFAGWRGAATSIVVSCRALGAPALAPAARRALAAGGAAAALRSVALAVAALSVPVAAALRRATWDDLLRAPAETAAEAPAERGGLAKLWLVFFLGAFPGLLAQGHAGAMVASVGGSAAAGVAALGAGSLAGRLASGVAADLVGPRACLAAGSLAAAAAIAAAPPLPGVAPVLAALFAIGLAYGLNAVVIPVLTSTLVGPRAFSRSYGVVLTAWGAAGLCAPVLAGALFDATGAYDAALLAAAACLAVASALVVTRT